MLEPSALSYRRPLFAAALALGLGLAAPADATWSIVAVDSETQEVAISSATCVTGIDLAALSPAIIVGRGAGAAQSFVDGSGQRRQIMADGFLNGTAASTIMDQLIAVSGSANHQNGIATALGEAATFSGGSTFAHSSGLTGSLGTLHYAIQGNILTGRPVVEMAEAALRDTPGDLPAKVMAAMEAARLMGGDGRCSCPASITGCGSPPPSFTKTADVGYFIITRYGDTDDTACNASGCADGDYFLALNVANASSGDPDAVFQLRDQFDIERTALEGRPDAIASDVEYRFDAAPVMRIQLRDWRGLAATAPITSVTAAHAPGSAGVASIGAAVDVGGGVYEIELAGAVEADRFEVTVDDGVRPVVLPPARTAGPTALVFQDGFESGDAGAWGATVP